MLKKKFPKNDQQAKEFEGFLQDPNTFGKTFPITSSFEATLEEVNNFLFTNGYCRISFEDLDEELSYSSEEVHLSKHGYKEEFILQIEKSISHLSLQQVIEHLVQFRDERDWKQFHSSKDLAIAISLEANELLELFLWKGKEEFDSEKLKEELADVLSFCFLLAEKHNLNIPKIVEEKINKNAMKYPVEKAKGTAKKYSEL